MDVSQYPTCTIPGFEPEVLRLRFRLTDIAHLKQCGIDLAVPTQLVGVEALLRVVPILSHAIAHQVVPKGADSNLYANRLKEVELQLMDNIDMLMLPEINKAITEAIIKVMPQNQVDPSTSVQLTNAPIQ